MSWRYTIQFHGWSASHCTAAETAAFLDRWRHRVGGYCTVVRYGHHSTDEGDTGLTQDELDAFNCPPCAARDELCREIDAAAERAA